jgi:hypothetical protein
MFASMSTFRGEGVDLDASAKAAGETMESWLLQFEGYRGLMIITNEASGTAHALTFWDSPEAAEKSMHGRGRMRDQMASAIGVDVVASEPYAVSFRVDVPQQNG